MRQLALFLALAFVVPVFAQKNRFELDFGLVDIERTGEREYKLPALPEADIAFGFKLTAAEGLHHLPKATVRITLLNEHDQVVFDVADDLANFTRAESTKEWFLYLRGVESQPPGPDGGWGTYARPRKSGRYRMTVETVKSNVTMTKFVVRLIGVGGGWK
jgi:hypothetical protein